MFSSSMSSTGFTKPRPRNSDHVRLTIDLAKYGLPGVVAQAANAGRDGPEGSDTSGPPRYFGFTVLADSGRGFRRRFGRSLSLTPAVTAVLLLRCTLASTFMKN